MVVVDRFSSGGMTPTGLIEIDPNSPEGNASLYGPFPITRFVSGLQGNAAFLLPQYRNGILIHTGEWGNFSNWKPPDAMPDSAGCVHTYSNDVARIWHEAVQLGAIVRNNTTAAPPRNTTQPPSEHDQNAPSIPVKSLPSSQRQPKIEPDVEE